MEENWESLDVDDSDLPSLILRPCSNSNKHNHNHISQPQQQHHQQQPQRTPPLISPRLIPGPAGKIQAAMNRKRLHHSDSPLLPTQDFLLKAAQCSDLSFQDDDDFKADAWLRALRFLGNAQSTTKDFVLQTTPLSRVGSSLPDGIVNQVVAIINSCTPNGLGDMTVTLKDTTGLIDATIHRKVLTESEFAKDISVKAAIILKKVSIFAPSSKTVYLNITRSNVVKVFHKDVTPASGNTNVVAPRVTYLPPDISKKSRVLEDELAQEHGRTKEIMHEVCQVATGGRNWLLDNQKKNGSLLPESGSDEFGRVKNTSTQNKAFWARECSATTEIYEKAGADVAGDNHMTLDSNEKRPKVNNLSEGHKNSVFVGNLNMDHGDETQQTDKAVKQSCISKVSLPQWTDEQLLELFEDDEPLF
ncbi:uncharacterized protein LOC108217875 [Daucus carota subsp. sativus]|uniref:Homologous recombination OB-fold protein OB-fold domain-containing protein n=1 Tax=Daucus carota subsp. sativus TaxID=79200 RepID=A0A165XG07_DAUCS|nr:PREDICTED: uncharacterized protein C17orf53 homolog [Daucus carota subsp. sativus]XP_017246262.1 PREDICTED: uncharacterized protein C17orf53 homolog [Daucus carota subsp. sativus]